MQRSPEEDYQQKETKVTKPAKTGYTEAEREKPNGKRATRQTRESRQREKHTLPPFFHSSVSRVSRAISSLFVTLCVVKGSVI